MDIDEIKLHLSSLFVTNEDQDQTKLDLKKCLTAVDLLKSQMTQSLGRV